MHSLHDRWPGCLLRDTMWTVLGLGLTLADDMLDY